MAFKYATTAWLSTPHAMQARSIETLSVPYLAFIAATQYLKHGFGGARERGQSEGPDR